MDTNGKYTHPYDTFFFLSDWKPDSNQNYIVLLYLFYVLLLFIYLIVFFVTVVSGYVNKEHTMKKWQNHAGQDQYSTRPRQVYKIGWLLYTGRCNNILNNPFLSFNIKKHYLSFFSHKYFNIPDSVKVYVYAKSTWSRMALLEAPPPLLKWPVNWD